MNLESIKIELNELQNAVKAANSGGLMGKPDLIIFHLEKAETMVKGLLGGYQALREENHSLKNELTVLTLQNEILREEVNRVKSVDIVCIKDVLGGLGSGK